MYTRIVLGRTADETGRSVNDIVGRVRDRWDRHVNLRIFTAYGGRTADRASTARHLVDSTR